MKFWILSAGLVLLISAVVYGAVSMDYQKRISEADSRIALQNKELIDVYTAPETPPPMEEVDISLELSKDSSFCLNCHEKSHLYSFHNPEDILKLDREKGRPVRVCTTCHGSPVMPVHFKAIQRGDAKCEACHLRGENSGFSVPQKREEDLLICQLCHANGNYITIHIDGEILKDAGIDSQWIRSRSGRECVLCHNKELYGGKDIYEVHRENAARSGVLSTEPVKRGEKAPLIVEPVEEVFPMKPSFGARDLDWPNKTAPSNTIVITE